MRRSEREVTAQSEIDEIINECDCCRLGFSDGNEVYIVPLSFGYDPERQIFYFHSAKEGRKIELIRQNGRAGFELDCGHRLLPGKAACGYSYAYRSVIGTGRISLVEDPAERERALELILEHYTGRSGWAFDEHSVQAAAVIRLEVEKLSCKKHDG